MTKIDHAVNLPKIFSLNNLSILPVSRGSYIIAHIDTFHNFEEEVFNERVIQFSLPESLQSITNDTPIFSEAIALNVAAASGILSDFLGIEDWGNNYLLPTVSGRMRSTCFEFLIKDTLRDNCLRTIKVNNAQIEIDAAYESRDFLALFEAKIDVSEDFIVRQLYYPYRCWFNKIQKEIKPIFLVYSNGIFHLREYAFEDPFIYSSIKLLKQKKYSLESTSISVEDIQNVLNNTSIVPELYIFPQADSFERIINLCELAKEQILTKDSITLQYAFDPRQTDYYTNAAIYLGLIKKVNNSSSTEFILSELGKSILQKKYKARQLSFCELILQHKPFQDSLKYYFSYGYQPSREIVTSIMKNSNLVNVTSEETFIRRASTIQSWNKWIIKLIHE